MLRSMKIIEELKGAYDSFLRDVREGRAEFPSVEQQHRMQDAVWRVPDHSRTAQRRAAYRARVASLAERIDTYGPSGNPTVAAVRAQTALNERDRAERQKGGAGGTGPLAPDRRLATFGMRVALDDGEPYGYRFTGGTARQWRCYRRAVERWTR
jgi:hypothetical protein